MAIEHDSDLLTFVGATPASLLSNIDQGVGPDFFGVTAEEGGFTLGVVYSLGLLIPLDLPSPASLVNLEYATNFLELVGEPNPVQTELRWSSTLGSPLVRNLIVHDGLGSSAFVTQNNVLLELVAPPFLFRRGDCTGNGSFDIGDSVRVLGLLFGMASPVDCLDACDVNDDGSLDVGDAVFSLTNLFGAGEPPPIPHISCGVDPTADGLDCLTHSPCE